MDPGGHKNYMKLFSADTGLVAPSDFRHIFFSHQDPDIIAAANGWLMVTDATAYLSALWMRFIPHFGVDELVINRITPIPDEGMTVDVGGAPMVLLPAHFLHSEGNFQVYDPVSKILYTGDLATSLGAPYTSVPDFDAHVQYMDGFHRRYLPSRRAIARWVNTVARLEIDIIAPQHGAIFPNREMVKRYIDWVSGIECYLDTELDSYPIPGHGR
jgi:flavorubredoxin